MNRKLIFTILVLLMFVGCDKAEIELPIMNTPVFSFTGEINGQPMAFSAGENDYYLFTNSYIDDNGVKVFFGELGNINACPGDCAASLTIEFRNSANGSTLPVGAVVPQQKDFYNGLVNEADIPPIEVEVGVTNNSFVNEAATFNWDFGNGMTTDILSVDPVVYNLPDLLNMPIEVELMITTLSGCESTISKTMDLLGPTPAIDCDLILSADLGVGPISHQLCAEMPNSPPIIYTWNYFASDISEPCIAVEATATTAAITAINADGCTKSRVVEILPLVNGDVVFCSADFSLDLIENITQYADISQEGLGTINIKYTDAAGVTYQSGLLPDQGINEFNILSNSEFDLNENAQRTQLFEFAFDAWLISESGDYLNIKNASGTWGIAIE